jgi:hypothetical protein
MMFAKISYNCIIYHKYSSNQELYIVNSHIIDIICIIIFQMIKRWKYQAIMSFQRNDWTSDLPMLA